MKLKLHISKPRLILSFIALSMIPYVFSLNMHGSDDWQSWNDISIKYKISEKMGLLWSPEIKIRDDISDLFSWRLRQGVFFDSQKNIILGFNYLYKDKKNINGDWRDEHRLEAHAIIKWKFSDLNFSDTNKYEYRMRGNKQNSRYRNSLLISKPISLHGVDFTPFIKNEIFYDFDTSKLNQNRFSFGTSYKLGKRTRFVLYYTRKSNRIVHGWDTTNIIGSKVKLDY